MFSFLEYVILICVLMLLLGNNILGVHENIVNSLDGNLDLTVYCKSKDDDLGVHLLHHGENYSWSFQPRRIIGHTLFFCGFTWNGELHWFDIYNNDELRIGCENCNWNIFKSGPCKTEKDGRSTCFRWNK
ncbi:unnamed protein product [Vicia faba]|uniref:S-protein homolog n=1 Tax=Vicia faba TaxID=3906 RepID=A0AAV0ZCW8_VICFA|nr:unnamed protein product [Vicia faba]